MAESNLFYGVPQPPTPTVGPPQIFTILFSNLVVIGLPISGIIQPELAVEASRVRAITPADLAPQTPSGQRPLQGAAQPDLLGVGLPRFNLLPLTQPAAPAFTPSVRAVQGRIADLPLLLGPSAVLAITPADLVSTKVFYGPAYPALETGERFSRTLFIIGIPTAGGALIKRRLLVGVGL